MNLRILAVLLRKELLLMRRTPYISKVIVMLPVMVMLVVPQVADLDVKDVGVSVVDLDHSQLSRRIIADIDASEWLRAVSTDATYHEAMTAVERGDADVILTIPAGFSETLSAIDISANGVNATKGMLGARYTSQSVIHTIGNWKSQNGQQDNTSTESSILNRFNPTLNFRNYMLPAIMVVLIIIICGFLPTLNLVGEKDSGTIEAMNVTPVDRLSFVLSKLIPYWVIGLIVVSIGMAVAWIAYDLVPVGSIGAIYLAAILFSLVMSGLGVIISNRSETLLQSIFIMFAVIMVFQLMGGLFTPIGSMPQWAQYLTYMVPPRYFNEIMRAVYLKGSTIADLGMSYLWLAGFAAALCITAAATYKKQA